MDRIFDCIMTGVDVLSHRQIYSFFDGSNLELAQIHSFIATIAIQKLITGTLF